LEPPKGQRAIREKHVRLVVRRSPIDFRRSRTLPVRPPFITSSVPHIQVSLIKWKSGLQL
jgi:hypothetical protein